MGIPAISLEDSGIPRLLAVPMEINIKLSSTVSEQCTPSICHMAILSHTYCVLSLLFLNSLRA